VDAVGFQFDFLVAVAHRLRGERKAEDPHPRIETQPRLRAKGPGQVVLRVDRAAEIRADRADHHCDDRHNDADQPRAHPHILSYQEVRDRRARCAAGISPKLGTANSQVAGYRYRHSVVRRSRRTPSREGVLDLLLLTADSRPESVLPALSLLPHVVRTAPSDVSSLLDAGSADVAIVDARIDLAAARGLCRLLGTTGNSVPVVAVVTEGGLVAVNVEWGLDDILLPGTGPAEIDARLRLLVGRRGGTANQENLGKITLGELVIDEGTYTARLRGRPLDLTYKEFELLKYLAQHAGRVFTRAQLLQEVWGYDFFGGTRTVDVHVRRLRAKLGTEHESLIGTVRNVGYKAVRPARGRASNPEPHSTDDIEPDQGGVQGPLADPLRSQ